MDRQIELSPVKTDSSYYIGEWVIEESISVRALNNQEIPIQNWLYDPVRGMLSFRNSSSFSFNDGNGLIVSFQFYPYKLRRFYNDLAVQPLDSSLLGGQPGNQAFLAAQNERGYNSDLRQRGSLSRGIIVGTNQDFALESGLDFELSGKLTDNVTISAILTDRSIPIQPDGATQNLKEFDRVFIKIQALSTKIEMGDVDVSFQKSTFAKLNRRLQGAAGYNTSKFGEFVGAVSVARGVFKSVSFNGLEGVQGPYRLTGNENEEFVIILAGTERVYVNGQLVHRGEEREYIIDYGLGEVHFTNNLLMKGETRIVIEYEYIDQNFNRTLAGAEGEAKFLDGRFIFGATVIRQADGNNLLSQRTLTESDIDVLRQAGDDRSLAIVSGAERVSHDEEDANVLYAEIDTVVNGQTFTIFKNKPGSDDAIFRVRFSNVGEGQGSYRRIGDSINGLLFEWVGPNQGQYEPFRTLPAPVEQQMAAFTGSYKISDHFSLFGEWAVSDFDQNRFSSIDDDDNVDQSYLGGFEAAKIKAGRGLFSIKGERRFIGSDFRFFERTREIEFDRKWNITNLDQSGETTNEIEATYELSEAGYIKGEYGFIERLNFTGERQASELMVNTGNGWKTDYNQQWIKSEDNTTNIDGNWFRQIAFISKQFKKGSSERSITPYLKFEHEQRIQRNQVTDSLNNQSLLFYEAGPGISLTYPKWVFDYSFGFRNDFRVLDNTFEKESIALQHSVQVNFLPGSYFNTENRITVRSKDFEPAFSGSGNFNKNGLLIRSNTSYAIPSDNWKGSFLYEVNTERQALLQETFIEVGPEIGQYVWDDLNGDGVEQLDEFFLELTPNEGTYIRQFLPSDELFPVIDLKARFRNQLHPFGFLKNVGEFGSFLKQMVFRSRIDVLENSTTDELSNIYLLKLNTFRDSLNTIQGRLAFEKSLSVLPEIDGMQLDVRYNQTRSLSRRSSETQSFFTDAFAVDYSYDLTAVIDGSSKIVFGKNKVNSNSISSRNFNILSKSFEQNVGATINRSWRTNMIFSLVKKEDKVQSSVQAASRIIKIRNTNRFFLWRKVQAGSSLEFRNVSVTGMPNAIGNFELTEGVGEGLNVLWSLQSSYRASNLVRINLVYDGRTVKDRPTIHTAKLTIKAVF